MDDGAAPVTGHFVKTTFGVDVLVGRYCPRYDLQVFGEPNRRGREFMDFKRIEPLLADDAGNVTRTLQGF